MEKMDFNDGKYTVINNNGRLHALRNGDFGLFYGVDKVKAYYVELSIGAVVMAENELDAMVVAEEYARDIVRDGELQAEDAREVKNIKQLIQYGWDGMCVPYNYDGDGRLKDILPDDEPFIDTKTPDMFA